METLQSIFQTVVRYCILFMETVGVAVLMFSAVKSVILLFRNREDVRLTLAEGIGLALEFKLGSEVLRTVIVRTWSELGILGAIVLLRVAITFVIQWEIKNEKEKRSAALIVRP